MSVFKRQIIKGSLSNFLGIGLGVLNNIWLFPLAFTLEELGIYRWVERTAVLIAAIALLGMHRTYVRYQSQFKGEEASQFLSNIIAIVAAVAGISGIGFTLFAGRIAELLDVPVADEIFVTRVNKNIVISLKEVSDFWGQIKHPVSKESGVDNLVALFP